MVGSYSLPWHLQASAAFQHNPGANYQTTWVITRAIVPSLTPTTQTINLLPQGAEFLPDIDQLDVSLIRKFEIGRAHLQARIDTFNALTRSRSSASDRYNSGPSRIYSQRMLCSRRCFASRCRRAGNGSPWDGTFAGNVTPPARD
jgi:hypothetical protein